MRPLWSEGIKMKKGVKKGALVTVRPRWYHPWPYAYGHILGYCGRSMWAVQGQFGIDAFHISRIRPVGVK